MSKRKGLIGYVGRDASERAYRRSVRASTAPTIRRLADGSWVGVGDTLLGPDGTQDVMLYGAYGTHALASEVE